MRLVLALIAAMLNAAGPWLCCCVAAGSVAAAAPASGPQPTGHSCCHEAPSAAPKAPAKPVPPPCPCKARVIAVGPALPADPPTVAADAAPDLGVLSEPAVVPLVLRAAPEKVRGLPVLTAEMRLRVHHVMLC